MLTPGGTMRVTTMVGGLVAATALTACSQGAAPRRAESSASPPVAVAADAHADRATLPGSEGLTKGQLLDKSLSYAGMLGVVSGEVQGPGTPREIGSGDPQNPNTHAVVDFPFLVTAIYGTATPPYRTGSVVTLRVPGTGSAASDGFPAIDAGSRLLVWATSQPATSLTGASAGNVLPVPDRANVAVVNGETVTWLGYQEPVATFVAHFTSHPVR